MTPQRLDEILSGFGKARVAVVGDFFLDKYLEIDPALTEISLETGLEARQVVAVRCQPGGAGNVAANLRALGIGEVICVGFIGDDGEGFELRRALERVGASAEHLLSRSDRFTPTYCKPIMLPSRAGDTLLPYGGQDGGVRELERLDTKNRQPLPQALEAELIARVGGLMPGLSAVIAIDQVQEPECGVITTGVRVALADLSATHSRVVSIADSRTRVGLFRNVMVKLNRREACAAVHPERPAHEGSVVVGCAAELSERVGAPVFLTMGSEGVAVVTPGRAQRVPTARLEGELDIVGAGDSATAGITSALCAGAGLEEAAIVGNIVASITVQQIGTTGTATQERVRERLAIFQQVWSGLPPPDEVRRGTQSHRQ
jgi:rfaE bifunctional protein kinase chain/domain